MMAMPGISKKMYQAGVSKALFYSQLLLITRHNNDLISWSLDGAMRATRS